MWTDVVDGVRAADTGADRILVVGHEPTWSDLVSVLTGGSLVSMPTAGLACVTISGTGWTKLGPGCAELQWHLNPRMVKRLM